MNSHTIFNVAITFYYYSNPCCEPGCPVVQKRREKAPVSNKEVWPLSFTNDGMESTMKLGNLKCVFLSFLSGGTKSESQVTELSIKSNTSEVAIDNPTLQNGHTQSEAAL